MLYKEQFITLQGIEFPVLFLAKLSTALGTLGLFAIGIDIILLLFTCNFELKFFACKAFCM